MARKFMSLDALSRTPEFRACTIRQQLFLQTYCASERDLGVADAKLATRAAFECEDRNTHRISFQVLRKRRVKAALRVWQTFGKSPRRIALDDLRADIAASKPGSPARAKLREIEAKLIGVKPKRKSK
jgi:hypothetical protein